MVLKVRGGVPIVWRSPSSMQFGVDAPLAVLDDIDEGREQLVAALVSGISRSGFDMMARTAGLGGAAGAELLMRLEPALEHAERGESATVLVVGAGALADELRGVLDAEGTLAAPGSERPDLAVIVAGWLLGAEDHGSWLRRDIPHLPVVTGDAGVTIGPFIEPGAGPCLYCVQLTRIDEDAAWPAIATQLWSRPPPALARLAVVEAAAFAARRIAERLDFGPPLGELVADGGGRVSTGSTNGGSTSGTSWRLDSRDGAVSSREWTRHAACRCATPAESDWAPAAALASPSSTRRAAGGASPA